MGKVAVHYGWIPMILYIGIVVFRGEADGRIYAEFASADVLEVVHWYLSVGLMVDCLRHSDEFGELCGCNMGVSMAGEEGVVIGMRMESHLHYLETHTRNSFVETYPCWYSIHSSSPR
jgi:hypothetical protein